MNLDNPIIGIYFPRGGVLVAMTRRLCARRAQTDYHVFPDLNSAMRFVNAQAPQAETDYITLKEEWREIEVREAEAES